MRNISESTKTLHVESTGSTNAIDTPEDLDLRNPAQLSHYLESSAFERHPRFSVAYQNECAQLKANTSSKVLVIPDLANCVGVAFHSEESNTWYALHCMLENNERPIQSFKAMSTEAGTFRCDKLLLINAPDVAYGQRLSKKDVEPIARKMLQKTGGQFQGEVGHMSGAFVKTFDERRVAGEDDTQRFGDDERRHVMIVPEAHSLYVFDENRRHIATHPL